MFSEKKKTVALSVCFTQTTDSLSLKSCYWDVVRDTLNLPSSGAACADDKKQNAPGDKTNIP